MNLTTLPDVRAGYSLTPNTWKVKTQHIMNKHNMWKNTTYEKTQHVNFRGNKPLFQATKQHLNNTVKRWRVLLTILQSRLAGTRWIGWSSPGRLDPSIASSWRPAVPPRTVPCPPYVLWRLAPSWHQTATRSKDTRYSGTIGNIVEVLDDGLKVILVPKPFGGRWPRRWTAARRQRVPLQWRNQTWQSLEEGTGKWCSECGVNTHVGG